MLINFLIWYSYFVYNFWYSLFSLNPSDWLSFYHVLTCGCFYFLQIYYKITFFLWLVIPASRQRTKIKFFCICHSHHSVLCFIGFFIPLEPPVTELMTNVERNLPSTAIPSTGQMIAKDGKKIKMECDPSGSTLKRMFWSSILTFPWLQSWHIL